MPGAVGRGLREFGRELLSTVLEKRRITNEPGSLCKMLLAGSTLGCGEWGGHQSEGRKIPFEKISGGRLCVIADTVRLPGLTVD